MALIDIVEYPSSFALFEARGSIGTLLDIGDICPNTQCNKDLELARGNVGSLVDEVTREKKVNERPGYAGVAGAVNYAF